jgi:hypothetical protein
MVHVINYVRARGRVVPCQINRPGGCARTCAGLFDWQTIMARRAATRSGMSQHPVTLHGSPLVGREGITALLRWSSARAWPPSSGSGPTSSYTERERARFSGNGPIYVSRDTRFLQRALGTPITIARHYRDRAVRLSADHGVRSGLRTRAAGQPDWIIVVAAGCPAAGRWLPIPGTSSVAW